MLQRHPQNLTEGLLVNRLHRIDQSGAVSLTKEKLIMKKRESVKLKGLTDSAKKINSRLFGIDLLFLQPTV